ncbi:MAG: MATE family efflux transporter [Armatimonadetes bacterium]|nr:MATE family efflux transporter [Armatimonadota bacterium]
MSLVAEREGEDQHGPEIYENASAIVWALAWPAVALNSLQVINGLLDRFFIGHLETAAATAQSAAMNVMFFVITLAMALATAATAIIARAFGAGDMREVRQAGRQVVGTSLVGGAVCGLFIIAVAPFASRMLVPSGDAQAINLSEGFLFNFSLGLPGIFIVQALAGAMRGVGDTKSPMWISGIQILLHITLNYLLIFNDHVLFGIHFRGAGWGLAGASAALSISATLSAIGYIYYAKLTPLGKLSNIRLPSREWLFRIIRIAAPAAMMGLMRVIALTTFTLILRAVPGASAAIAGMGFAFAIESIMFMPAFGLQMAAAALVGQSLGMKRPDRAERLAWNAAHWGGAVALSFSVVMFALAPYVAPIMLPGKPEVISHVVILLRALCTTEVMFAYYMVFMGAMQGAGETKIPFWITFVCMWVFRVPAAYLLAITFGYGALGAYIGLAIGQFVQGPIAAVAFIKGTWKTARV